MIRRPPRSTLFPSPPLSRSLPPARPDADPPRRGALLDRRAGVDREALRRGPRELQEDRRAPPELALRVARALSDRRGLLSRGGVRQGHQGVRGVRGVLPPPPDRRPRPVPPGDELLRSDEIGRASCRERV